MAGSCPLHPTDETVLKGNRVWIVIDNTILKQNSAKNFSGFD
jgi:hypothetical protein